MTDRIFIKEYMETYFQELEPKEFYRNIFPEGELQNHEERDNNKYNGVALEILPKEVNKTKVKRYVITDELDIIDKLLQSDNFIIASPISYVGKSRVSENARYIYAMAIDLDGITEKHYLIDLFYQIDNEILPKPTYIVWSGTGLHLYYQFLEPLPCFNNINKQLTALKTALTKKIWNKYVTSLHDKKQIESLFQGFRMPGTITKGGNRAKAFEYGDKVSIDYLNDFVDEEARVKEFTYKSKMTLKAAAAKYPEWYQKRIIEKRPKGTWVANKAVYDWWLHKLQNNITEGHRYYGIMVLAIYAKKCGVSREELEADAFGLVDRMEELTITDDNHFTDDDVLAALEMYNDNYITFPIHTISDLTAIHIEKNKRNYRKQSEHIKLMNFIREEINGNKDWRNKDGRPSRKDEVVEWKKNNPVGTPKECAAATGVSLATVYRHWTYGEE